MGLYRNGKPLRVYRNGKLLNAYRNGKKIWPDPYPDHEIQIVPSSLSSWKCDETHSQTITITAGNAPFGASLTSGDSYFTIITDFDNMRIVVSPKSQNNTGYVRNGTLTITDNDGDSIDVGLMQGKQFGPWVIVGENKISISYDLGDTWQ